MLSRLILQTGMSRCHLYSCAANNGIYLPFLISMHLSPAYAFEFEPPLPMPPPPSPLGPRPLRQVRVHLLLQVLSAAGCVQGDVLIAKDMLLWAGRCQQSCQQRRQIPHWAGKYQQRCMMWSNLLPLYMTAEPLVTLLMT